MRTCVFPGSFDPVTAGHLDVIRRASLLFDRVTVTVMINVRKQNQLSLEERIEWLKKACEKLPNVRIDSWDGLLADYLRIRGEKCVIRGVRNGTEFDSEITAARINRRLNPEMDTLLMPAGDGLDALSSSAVREIAAFGGDIRPYLPETVAEEISRRLSKQSL